MPLKLSVRVGQSVAVGGPATVRVESKSGQEVGLVFDADRSVPIRIIPNTPAIARHKGVEERPSSRAMDGRERPNSREGVIGLGRSSGINLPAHDGPASSETDR